MIHRTFGTLDVDGGAAPSIRCYVAASGWDPMPAQWVPRLEEVGVNPDGDEPMTMDGGFPVIEASFTLATNYTGVRITPEFLSSATFIVGSGD